MSTEMQNKLHSWWQRSLIYHGKCKMRRKAKPKDGYLCPGTCGHIIMLLLIVLASGLKLCLLHKTRPTVICSAVCDWNQPHAKRHEARFDTNTHTHTRIPVSTMYTLCEPTSVIMGVGSSSDTNTTWSNHSLGGAGVMHRQLNWNTIIWQQADDN